MLGAGVAPAGTSPAGIGQPDTTPAQSNVLFPDPVTGLGQTGRYIHPVTRTYTFASDGRTQGYATAQQLVDIALRTVRGQCAIPNLGQTFTTIQEKGPFFNGQVAAAVNTALADLVRARIIQLVSVDVQNNPNNPDGTIGFVTWRDLTAPDAAGPTSPTAELQTRF